ncbi:MAG: acylneuraminate cytidylyltransferase family protein [Sandaracinaceae bacterium]
MTLVAWTIIKRESERVPDKNFRSLGGRPLFRWILDTLATMPELDRVVINSDACDRLRELGAEEDARVTLLERPAALSGHSVTANELLAQDLPRLGASEVLMTHATNPFLSAQTIRRALTVFRAARDDGSADSLFSVTRRQARTFDAAGRPLNHDPRALVPTQALAPWLEENSCLYVFSPESFAATGSRIGERPLPFETPKWESLDIDDEEDWTLAERVAAGIAG